MRRLVERKTAVRVLGSARLAQIEKELRAVGGVRFFGLEARDALEYVSLWFVVLGLSFAAGLVGAALGAGLKGFLPGVFAAILLRSRYRQAVEGRRKAVMSEAELPSVLETLASAVGTGITLEGAIRHVVSTRKGVVRDLLDEALAHRDAGEQLELALSYAAEKSLHPSFRAISRSVEAGRKTAAGLAEILEKAAHDIWEEKKIEARERAGKLPNKLFLPVMICYFIPAAVILSLPFVMSFLKTKEMF
ncbi:type II secretion system F family protein [Desulfofundulus thermosubterraneus]|uniref:Type II secretion system protein F (GspF) n=1 Tax=Desulfofundulus thermosubterraneus DSM 16057 TaxID=1121432 RepID=A0A1M6JAR6_9FIRM|nr:type II secretion system F family protein [Desulfofundulus thermosubterraneus]SHJ43791.1 type II secretion system protein F (GspF) [Desulfofundulus thermosubterraneus DSM 16057]